MTPQTPLTALIAEIIRLVRGDPILNASLPSSAGWIDYGLPPASPAAGPSTCIRLDRLIDLDDKLGRRSVMVKLWSTDTSSAFLATVDRMKLVLQSSDQLLVGGYLPQPEGGRACFMFPVTF